MATMHMDATEYQALMKVQEQLELRIKENAEKDKIIQDLKDVELTRMKNHEKMVVKKVITSNYQTITSIDINEYTIQRILDDVTNNYTINRNDVVKTISRLINEHIKNNSHYSTYQTDSVTQNEDFEYVNLSDIEELMLKKATDNLDNKLKNLLSREQKINDDFKIINDREALIRKLENTITKKDKEYNSLVDSSKQSTDKLQNENSKLKTDARLYDEKVTRIITDRDRTFKEVNELVDNLGLFNYTTVKIMVQQKLKQ
jgi:hypothetical protein